MTGDMHPSLPAQWARRTPPLPRDVGPGDADGRRALAAVWRRARRTRKAMVRRTEAARIDADCIFGPPRPYIRRMSPAGHIAAAYASGPGGARDYRLLAQVPTFHEAR